MRRVWTLEFRSVQKRRDILEKSGQTFAFVVVSTLLVPSYRRGQFTRDLGLFANRQEGVGLAGVLVPRGHVAQHLRPQPRSVEIAGRPFHRAAESGDVGADEKAGGEGRGLGVAHGGYGTAAVPHD